MLKAGLEKRMGRMGIPDAGMAERKMEKMWMRKEKKDTRRRIELEEKESKSEKETSRRPAVRA